MSPLSVDHLLHGNIHMPSLKRCATQVAHCFHKALTAFDDDVELFTLIDQDNETIKAEKDPLIQEFMEDKIIWDNFGVLYPNEFNDLNYAIEVCLDNSISRKTPFKEQIILQFLMDRLRTLASCILSVHTCHTLKIGCENSKSPGPVPLSQIYTIRSNLGLPVSNWERDTAIHIYENLYD